MHNGAKTAVNTLKMLQNIVFTKERRKHLFLWKFIVQNETNKNLLTTRDIKNCSETLEYLSQI